MLMATASNSPLIIGGVEQAAADGGTFEVRAPASGEVVGTVARATVDDVNRAVAAARDGFVVWSSLDPEDRERIFLRAADVFTWQAPKKQSCQTFHARYEQRLERLRSVRAG